MSWKAYISVVLAAALSCLAAGPARAQAADDPIIKMESSTTIELDLGKVVRDVMPRLLPALAVEDPADSAIVGLVADYLGLDELGHVRLESRQKGDRATGKVVISVADPEADGLLARLFRLPNGRCTFSRYVRRDDLVVFSTIHDLAGTLEMLLDDLDRPPLGDLAANVPRNADGDISLNGFTPRTDLLPLLRGEMDLVILEPAGGAPVSPNSIPAYLVLGSTDGFALRDRILQLITDLGGESGSPVAEMIRSLTPEQVGGFELTVPPFGGALAVSKDFLVLGMDAAPLREMLVRPAGDLDVPEGVQWVFMDGARYGRLMSAFTAMGAKMAPGEQAETAWMAKLYDSLYGSIESEEVLYRTKGGALEITSRVDGPVLAGLYQTGLTALDNLPALLREEKEKKATEAAKSVYRNAVSELDGAMTAYATDHDGTYPADPHDLVTDGYLESFPLDEAVPPGQYAEGAYTYLPLHDDAGRIAGYFLFVYGPDPHGGYDVFTPSNVNAAGNFQIGRDGRPDGVIAFCYDGLALEQMDAYNNR